MRHAKAHRFHRVDDGRRRRGTTGRDVDAMFELHLRFNGSVNEHVEHDRCAAEVRDAIIPNRREDPRGLDAAKAHMRAARRGDGPRIRPAVAVEHRQRPQINAIGIKTKRKRVAERVQVRAAMVIDDALRIAGRSRRVQQ